MSTRLFTFCGGDAGVWRVERMTTVSGESLPAASKLAVVSGAVDSTAAPTWILRGVTSNERYVTRQEKGLLMAKQPVLGRPEATCAALIPIRKNAAWWSLPQDERRKILEESSKHIQIGLNYLPAVARRLHHCRDLGDEEPFDFLTWFEFAPADSGAFEALTAQLRATEEWTYVERECEIRLLHSQE